MNLSLKLLVFFSRQELTALRLTLDALHAALILPHSPYAAMNADCYASIAFLDIAITSLYLLTSLLAYQRHQVLILPLRHWE